MSDLDVPCERIPLEHDWPGWWAKIELFKLSGPVLFFDLDTAIVGDLGDIANAATGAEKLIMLRDFYRLERGLGSGVMAWAGGDGFQRMMFDQFMVDPKHWMTHCPGGDQEFVERAVVVDDRRPWRWQDRLPGQVVSYKVHCRGGQSPVTGRVTASGIPPDARVVCLHGFPKFGDMPVNDPVRQAWEMAA